jgi:nucleoside phosphorylase
VIAAVVFAVPAEFAPWHRRHPFRPIVAAGLPAFEAQIGLTRVRVTTSGIGAPDAVSLAGAIHAGGADLLVVSGVGGGLKVHHPTGEILVARNVRPEHGDRRAAADERLLSVAARAGATIVDAFVSADRIVARREDKARLASQGDAVDMESFPLISEARAHGMPAVAIRVVGDTFREDLPIDFTRAIRPGGAFGVSRLLPEIASHPGRWAALVRFGLSQKRSLTRLAGFLDRFFAAIDYPDSGAH